MDARAVDFGSAILRAADRKRCGAKSERRLPMAFAVKRKLRSVVASSM
jgi:hypothetical protein